LYTIHANGIFIELCKKDNEIIIKLEEKKIRNGNGRGRRIWWPIIWSNFVRLKKGDKINHKMNGNMIKMRRENGKWRERVEYNGEMLIVS
jgi:hypothetical protein